MSESCFLCADSISIYSRGSCGHLICYRCATKMRVVCEQMYCPICRQDLPDVCFITNPSNYEHVQAQSKPNAKGIRFESCEVFKAFRDLLEIRCQYCNEEKVFENFDQLRDHVNIVHRRSYCPTCLESLKLFPSERRAYTREEFARHSISGDNDNSSFIGHPICRFCGKRFFDNDDLFVHSTSEHFYCIFCRDDGTNVFYREYEELRDHFRSNHYLCEEGECKNMQLRSNVFRSEIELKAHMVKHHAKNRKEAKLIGSVPIDLIFNTASSERGYAHRRRAQEAQGENENPKSETTDTTTAPPVNICDEDFPSLSGSAPVIAPDTRANVWASRVIAKPNRAVKSPGWKNPLKEDANEDIESNIGETDKILNECNINAPKLFGGYASSASIGYYKNFNVKDEDFPALPSSAPSLAITEVPSWPRKTSADVKGKNKVDKERKQKLPTIAQNPMTDRFRPPPNSVIKEVNAQAKVQPNLLPKVPDFSAESFPSLLNTSKNQKSAVKSDVKTTKQSLSLKSLGEALMNDGQSIVKQPSEDNSSKGTKECSRNLNKPRKHSFVSALSLLQKTSRSTNITNKNDAPYHEKESDENNNLNVRENGVSPPLASSVEKDSIKSLNYIKPADFDTRNSALNSEIRNSLNDNYILFDEFKRVSADYRNNVIDVNEYLRQCTNIVGLNQMSNFMFELIALLPDIRKQNELHGAYTKLVCSSMPKDQAHKQSSWKVYSLVPCTFCGQLIVTVDFVDHYKCHSSFI